MSGNASSNTELYSSVEDYFSDFSQLLDRELPSEDPGSTTTKDLVGEYVHRDKRSILLLIQTGPDAVLSVRYKMAVPANGAKIFGLEEDRLVPHGEPVFGLLRPAEIAGRVAEYAMHPWEAEIARIKTLEDTAESSKMRRAAHNVLVYWNGVRRLLGRVYSQLGIRAVAAGARASSRGASGPDPTNLRASTPKPDSDPAPAQRNWAQRRRTSSERRRRNAMLRRTQSARKRTTTGGTDPTRRRRKRTV